MQQCDGSAFTSSSVPRVTCPTHAAARPTTRTAQGFEGMAYYGEYLYPLLEGPLYVTVTNSTTNTTSKQYEMYNGLEYLHIFRFSTKSRTWVNWPGPTPNTTTTRKYLLDANGNAIGDFNMIDERYGLVLERDNNEGDP